MLPINSAAERPTGVSEIRRNAVRRFRAAIGISICRSRSPGARMLRWLPVTKSTTLARCSLPPDFQIRADAVERRRQRDHRAGRQGHTEVAADGGGLPLKEARNARQHWLIRGDASHSGRAGQRVQLRDRAGCRDGQPGRADRQRRPFEVGKIDQPREVGLGFRKQPGPPPASQASPAVQTGNCSRLCGRATSLMVFKSMDRLVLSTRCVSL